MRWTLALLNNVALDNPGDATTGTALTDGAGHATAQTPPVTIVNNTLDASVVVTWSFEFPSDGTSTCNQAFEYFVPVIP
jgi:hypothetical protein